MRDRGGLLDPVDGLDQDGELVAAHARDQVGLVGGPHAARDFRQEQIADRMAIEVVDRLEAVEIHDGNREGASLARAFLHALVEHAAVGQPGQRIGHRHRQRVLSHGLDFGARRHDLVEIVEMLAKQARQRHCDNEERQR